MEVLCGEMGAEGCDPQYWFRYMGSTDNGFSPFNIYYEFGTDNQTYYNPEAAQCYDNIDVRAFKLKLTYTSLLTAFARQNETKVTD